MFGGRACTICSTAMSLYLYKGREGRGFPVIVRYIKQDPRPRAFWNWVGIGLRSGVLLRHHV